MREHADWCDEPQHHGADVMVQDDEWTACFRVLGQVDGVGEVWKVATEDGPRIVVDAPGVDLTLHPDSVRAVAEMLSSTPAHELPHVALAMPRCIAQAVLTLDVESLRAIGRTLSTVEPGASIHGAQ